MARTYYAQILSWDWADIVRKASIVSDAVMQDDQLVGSVYLGSVMSLAPSGKFYMPWTSNQTADDVDKDGRWYAALDKAATKFGGWIESGEGDPTDLYFCILIEDVDDPDTARSEIVSVDGVNPSCDICGKAQQPEDDWNGETGNHVDCEARRGN